MKSNFYNQFYFLIGVEQYNTSEGYASTFKWTGTCTDQTPYDNWGRRMCQVVAIDALSFKNPTAQYQANLINREILKVNLEFNFIINNLFIYCLNSFLI